MKPNQLQLKLLS